MLILAVPPSTINILYTAIPTLPSPLQTRNITPLYPPYLVLIHLPLRLLCLHFPPSPLALANRQPQRATRFMDSYLYSPSERALSPAPPAILSLWGEPESENGYYRHVDLGDQGYFWAIKKYAPQLFYPVPLNWEVSPSCIHNLSPADYGRCRRVCL
jgi:hypothetical protein